MLDFNSDVPYAMAVAAGLFFPSVRMTTLPFGQKDIWRLEVRVWNLDFAT